MTQSTTYLDVGCTLPNHPIEATSGFLGNINQFKGNWTLLYFYPKDNTSGCTKQAEDIRDHWESFTKAKITVFGVSKDSLKSHENFKAKYDLPFELITDPDAKLCELFGVYQEKSMYGRKYMGIVRSSFLINPKAQVVASWRKVKVTGHREEIMKKFSQLINE